MVEVRTPQSSRGWGASFEMQRVIQGRMQRPPLSNRVKRGGASHMSPPLDSESPETHFFMINFSIIFPIYVWGFLTQNF
jgi:hypothetical protein